MAILKCKICGGDIILNDEKTICTCEYCGSSMTLPKVSDEQKAALYNRGNHFRRIGEFDKALAIYENLVGEDNTDAEAHWCCVLCRFGIEYVEDPATYEFLPTCHRASFDSIMEDVDYLAAIEYSDGITRRQYQKDAIKISEVQKGILATSQNEEPFDVFICYKETDDTTKERTRDSVDAQEIYYQLIQEGYRVFFSRITLEDKAGTEYEPYIFAALNSAKVMIVIGSKPEYFNAVWVKNEWSRFISLMKKDRSKLLIPCYKEMDPYDLPEQLSILQSYDMTKIGFLQDLIRGIRKIARADAPKENTVVVGNSAGVAPLLKRAFMFLEDGEWNRADNFCEQVLNQEPENAQAYLGKLMVELRVRRQEDLEDCEQPFNNSNNYQKAVRFGDEKFSGVLSGYIDHINERNENIRLTEIYNNAVFEMKSANSETSFKSAAATFKTIHGFKDADSLAEQCLERAGICRKDDVYAFARSQMTGNTVRGYETAIKTFSTISGWKDADNQIYACQRKIEEIKTKEEANRLDRERQAVQKRIATEKIAKKCKRIFAIIAPIVVACIAFLIVLTTVIIPKKKLNKAMRLLDSGDYDAAYALLEEIGNRDAIASSKYDRAVALIDSGDYEAAYILLKGLDYKDSASLRKTIEDSDGWIKICPVGGTVFIGAYEQDNNTSNGKEDIEWIVLAREGDRILVISRYALDCKQYNTSYTYVTWETCSLRKWLNGTFLNTAFSESERAIIPSVTVSADKNPSSSASPGNSTMDQVFLLSITEANKYFSSDSARQCQGTAYCYAQGAYEVNNVYCLWWLRSPGRVSYSAASVSYGFVDNFGKDVTTDYYAVRPALWIDLGD